MDRNKLDESKSVDNFPSILDSVPSNALYKSVTDRYFSRRYCIGVKHVLRNDHLLLFHSNRICVICLAPSHPVFDTNEKFTVDYKVGNLNRTDNTVKGKGKKGGQLLNIDSVLCRIKCTNGIVYEVSSCINGKLVEVNEALLTDPMLLKSHSDSDGYVAVILSNIAVSESRKNELLNNDEYIAAITERS